MRPELEILLQLQEIDLRIRKLNQEKEGCPARYNELCRLMEEKRAELDQLTQRLDEVDLRRREVQEELEVDTLRLGKSQNRLSQIQTSREYSALIKEIEEIKRANKEREEEIEAARQEAQELRSAIEAKEKELQALEADAKAEKERMEEMVAGLEAEVARLEQEREAILPQIKPDLLSRYNFLRDKRAGIVVAAVVNSVCRGCNMNLPPQLCNELIRDDKVYTCPTCQRLIYHQDAQEE